MPSSTQCVMSATPLYRHTFISVPMAVGFYNCFNAISYHSSYITNPFESRERWRILWVSPVCIAELEVLSWSENCTRNPFKIWHSHLPFTFADLRDSVTRYKRKPKDHIQRVTWWTNPPVRLRWSQIPKLIFMFIKKFKITLWIPDAKSPIPAYSTY